MTQAKEAAREAKLKEAESAKLADINDRIRADAAKREEKRMSIEAEQKARAKAETDAINEKVRRSREASREPSRPASAKVAVVTAAE